jgi:hypothetical protein
MVQTPWSKGKRKKYSFKHSLLHPVLEAIKLIYKDIIVYIRAGRAMTVAPWQFLIFCATLFLSIQQSHTLNKVKCQANGEFDSHLVSRNADPGA